MSMSLPIADGLTRLSLRDAGPGSNGTTPRIPEDILQGSSDRTLQKLQNYAHSLPYAIEDNARMQRMLDFFILRIVQCVEAKDFDPGLLQWDSMLTHWRTLKYPIPQEKRLALARLYFHICTTPGTPTHIVSTCTETLIALTRSRRKVSVDDLRLPWKPIFDILRKDMFLTKRQFEIGQTTWYMGYLATHMSRFFHPAAIDEMLSVFLPMLNGTNLDSVLATQYYLVTFLPISHPQSYLPMLFRLWQSFNSYAYDERMLQFLSRLAQLHVDPAISDPKRIKEIPDDAHSEGEGRPNWDKSDMDTSNAWSGIYKDVGIFTDDEWSQLMCKTLASMEIPLKDGGSLNTGPSADKQAGFEVGRLPKPVWRITSLARIIVYSMSQDGPPAAPSFAPTPFTPFTPGHMTPMTPPTPQPGVSGNLGDYLSHRLASKGLPRAKTYMAGSKALDTLHKIIATTESFFHPSSSGSWTNDLSAFIKQIVFEFNKRWHEERASECKTPMHRRLTHEMRRELVKCLRTPALLAMFSQDSSTVSSIQSCLKSMSVMEPDLILHPILERAYPALEALVETQRTLAVIRALNAVAPAIVCRDIYYPGATHLVSILQSLLPGIDMNDPAKTLATTAFLVEISQSILIGELTNSDNVQSTGTGTATPTLGLSTPPINARKSLKIPSFNLRGVGFFSGEGDTVEAPPRRSNRDEDATLIETTGSFADWVASFIRRVILLLENLPEEGVTGNYTSGQSEAKIIDAVTGACSQICVHLSEPLYDLVLNMIFDYATNNVRANATRAIHQLVECVANANPYKTLAKFFPVCDARIRTELESGASSLRTTSESMPLPADTTLHWNLAILRGTMYNDGKAVLPYKDRLLSLLRLLCEKTYSKRGYTWTGRLLSSVLLCLTHTYPTENRFVNPEEWESPGFQRSHIRHWGKLYKPEEIKITWHVPTDSELNIALDVFRQLVEPSLDALDALLKGDIPRDANWRNSFCRHLTFVRDAFAGTPTLAREETITQEDIAGWHESSDIMLETPEMIAHVEPLNSGFPLTDPNDPRYKYYTSLRHRFGQFLHRASTSLLHEGEQNTVDAVMVLIRSFRTFMLEYGDSRDRYFLQTEQYANELNTTRHYGGQKEWPRAVYVRRARMYHSARLRWNSIDRRRTETEEQLVDDLVEWSLWHYATVRATSQSLLESLCSAFDGFRRRCLPKLYEALVPGTDDDRMKGALWTLNSNVFAKYAVGEPTLAKELLNHLFQCQHNEKPSIQACVSKISDTCLGSFLEPMMYNIVNTHVNNAVSQTKALIKYNESDHSLVTRCAAQRVERERLADAALSETTVSILAVSQSPKTHWKYSIVALRMLRTLIRRDMPMSPEHLRCIIKLTYDSHPTMRYYAQRAVMKSSRFIKLSAMAHNDADRVMEQNHNPNRRHVLVRDQSPQFTQEFLRSFKQPVDIDAISKTPMLCEKIGSGWLAWAPTVDLFVVPQGMSSLEDKWTLEHRDSIAIYREHAMDSKFWRALSKHFSAENHAQSLSQDHVSCVKSICQLLDVQVFNVMKPIIEELLANKNKDKNKQRGAAEFIAGIIGGSKHWGVEAQNIVWDWFEPYMKTVLRDNLKADTINIWISFLEYMFANRDPRRVQPLVDFVVDQFTDADWNTESSFDATRALAAFRAFYENLGWKATAWMPDAIGRAWPELTGEHDEVRAYIGDLLVFSGKTNWLPKVSAPTAEAFVREARTTPADADLMRISGDGYHTGRMAELVKMFHIWRDERLPGVRAFQSTYDKVGTAICRWLILILHDTNAASAFQYILPLMPELFRFAELNDSDDLAYRAELLLVRMCGVSPPPEMVNALLDNMFAAIRNSTSWRVRLKVLPLLQVFYFRQMPLIKDVKVIDMLDVVCHCLDDQVIEVREMAASTLTGILRVSPRRSVLTLRDRFVRLLQHKTLPERTSPSWGVAVRQRHAAILGCCALVDAHPFTVERWLPPLLTGVIAEHTYDPLPISATVRRCASNFKKTHQDTWHEDKLRFSEEQMIALSTLLTGSSYYA